MWSGSSRSWSVATGSCRPRPDDEGGRTSVLDDDGLGAAPRGRQPGSPYPMRRSICGVPKRPSDSRSCSRARHLDRLRQHRHRQPRVGRGQQHPLQRLPGAATWSTAVLPGCRAPPPAARARSRGRGPGPGRRSPATAAGPAARPAGRRRAAGTPSGAGRCGPTRRARPGSRGRARRTRWRAAGDLGERVDARSHRAPVPASTARHGRPR